MKKKLLINLSVLLLAVIILSVTQRLLMPKYMTSIFEGNLVEEYYDQEKDHDVIFLGDCEVFSNFSPVTLWENYGITSYIRGSAEQSVWQSYYLLEETLKYEHPDAVVFNVLAMKNSEPHKEEYNRLTLDGMRLSGSKISAIKASMLEDEQFITYIFPILRYHSRWSELTSEDFKYLFGKEKVSHNGFLMRTDIKPLSYLPKPKELADYNFSEKNNYYLERITALCKENDIELILIKAPSAYPHWYDEWDEQIKKFAQVNELTYINFLGLAAEIGIDYKTDTYDAGMHLNLSGAEKLTDYFGRILSEDFGLTDRSNKPELQRIWEPKVRFYYEMKEHQEYELEEYGYLKSYGASPVKNGGKENE